MKWRTKKPTLFSLVAGILTLFASGDDFNFARLLILPSTLFQVHCGHFPLDDETTDFVESAKSEVSQSQEVHYAPPVVWAATVTPLQPPYLLLPFESVSSWSDHLHYNCLFTPLRC
jgi:hypothetical protein